MQRLLSACTALAVLVLMALGYHAWWQAEQDAERLLTEATSLMLDQKGSSDLGASRLPVFLAVKDPTFLDHNGIDLLHPRPFRRTLTQSLARDHLDWRAPGLGMLQEVFYTLALDQRLPKAAQVTLYLDRLPMGTDRTGQEVTGFFTASELVFGRRPADLTEVEFLTLLSATLAPLPLHDARADALPKELVAHRERLLAFLDGDCALDGPSEGLPESC